MDRGHHQQQQQQQQPFGGLHAAAASVAAQAASNWGALAHHCSSRLQTPWQTQQSDRQQQRQHRPACGSWAPALASISFSHHASSSGRGAQPLYSLAMAKDEVKARLAPIPVYTVANPKNEFVLVAGENNTQLGFFFFRKEDAEAIISKVREENPRLARDSKVLRVTMDNVYEVFTTPREQTGLQGIHFRFMPDMEQVRHALSLYREAGVPTKSFIGVPVFQAEGLTVTTQDTQYVPLFLTKEDLDAAVGAAYRARNATQISAQREKAAKAEADYQEAAAKADAAQGRDKASAEARASKAKARLEGMMERVSAVERAPPPKLEVGSLEEVMMRMTASEGSELTAWSQVMFVAPGLLQQAGAPLEAAAERKK